MATRVQTQLLPEAPNLQPTISAGGRYTVQVQQAGKNKWNDLADALSQVNPALREYGAIQQINLEEGRKLGEVDAAKNQLDIAQSDMDKAGERLVAQGLLPRSQLLGYQQGYRKRIGQRVARNTYMTGLNSRMDEITDPEATDDVLDRVMAEERQKARETLQGRPLAEEGFTEYATNIENRFISSATTKRDAAVQSYNENIVIEDLNERFGSRLIGANPDDIGSIQNEIKNELDRLADTDKFDRSRVVEMFWNGVGMPTVTGLIVDGQPDKAEKVLEAMLDIDLTGKGGRLGNINREGAYIRSRAVELRNRIAAKRDQLESETGKEADNIENLYVPAASAVVAGMTNNTEIDQRSIDAISRSLQDAGYPEEESGLIANSLLESQDLQEFQRYLTKYLDDDSKRMAYGEAQQRFTRFNILVSQEKQYFVTSEQIDMMVKGFQDAKAKNPDLTANEYAASGAEMGVGPVTDPKAKAALQGAQLELEAQKWFIGSEEQKVSQNTFEKGLNALVTTIHEGRANKTETDAQFLTPYEKDYKLEYIRLVNEESSKLVNDPNKEEKMKEAEATISKKLLDRWKRLQETLRTAEDASVDLTSPADTPPELKSLKEAYKKMWDETLPFWQQGINFVTFGQLVREFESDIGVRFDTNDPSNLKKYVAHLEKQLANDPKIQKDGKRKAAVQNMVDTYHKVFGFEDIKQVPDGAVAEGYDYRLTKMFGSPEKLNASVQQFARELKEFDGLELGDQNRDTFEMLRLMRDKFGILTMDDIKTFWNQQSKLFNPTQR